MELYRRAEKDHEQYFPTKIKFTTKIKNPNAEQI